MNYGVIGYNGNGVIKRKNSRVVMRLMTTKNKDSKIKVQRN